MLQYTPCAPSIFRPPTSIRTTRATTIVTQGKTGSKRKAGDTDSAKPKSARVPSDKELQAINWVSVIGHLKRRKILPQDGCLDATDVDWGRVAKVVEGLEKEATAAPAGYNGNDSINILNGPSPSTIRLLR